MDVSEIEKKVSDLEKEITALKQAKQASADATGFRGRVKGVSTFLKENWVLLSFVTTLLVAGWGKFHYQIAYFEKFETAKTIRKLSDFHAKMGDTYLAQNEFPSAKHAYAEALKINPDNERAVWGSELAQVFDPAPGETAWAPEVVDERLNYLSENAEFGNDYRLNLLKAFRYEAMFDFDKATAAIQECLNKREVDRDKFPGCYLERGIIEMRLGRPDLAMGDFTRAYDPNHPSLAVLNDIAACKFLTADFKGAYEGFVNSYAISPTAITALNIGETDWYLGDFASGLKVHQPAADYLDGLVDDSDRFSRGDWIEPYFPLYAGDHETSRRNVQIGTMVQKRATFHLALAIDHALLNDQAAANKEFAQALKSHPNAEQVGLMQNRMQSVENMAQMSEDAKKWFNDHRKTLDDVAAQAAAKS